MTIALGILIGLQAFWFILLWSVAGQLLATTRRVAEVERKLEAQQIQGLLAAMHAQAAGRN